MYTRLVRWRINFFPAFRNTGGRITHVSGDLRAIQLKLPLNRNTKNYVGTLYGGSIKLELETTESLTREFSIDLCDAEGVLHAKVTKKVYFRRKAENTED